MKKCDKSFQEERTVNAKILRQEGAIDEHGIKMVTDSIIRDKAEMIRRQHILQGFLRHGKKFCLYLSVKWNIL